MTRSYRRDAKSRLSSVQNSHRRNGNGSRWNEDFSYEESAAYGKAQRDLRGSYGMIDGLKTTKAEFDGYMDRRAAADARARGEAPDRGGSAWIGMSGRRVKQGKCRVVRPADKAPMTIKDVQIKLNELSAKYDRSNPEHRRQWAQLNARIRQLRAA